MALLQKARYEQAALKAGLLGFMGSGKTTTAAMIAIGLAKQFGQNKPIAMFDTENGSDFLIPKFEAEGLELLVIKSGAFADLIPALREAEKTCSVFLVDSITHLWREIARAHAAAIAKRRHLERPPTRLSMQDWAEIKDVWAPWPTAYLNSPLHILVCGRAGYEWDELPDEDNDGKSKLTKVGTKMKVEGEFGFEPNLLIEMLRVPADEAELSGRKRANSRRVAGLWAHRAVVLKDRTDTINGQTFDFAKPRVVYKAGDFQQVFKRLAPIAEFMARSQGPQRAIDETRNSEALFPGPNGESRYRELAGRKEVALAEAKGILDHMFPGQAARDKAVRSAIVERLFSAYSTEGVAAKPLEQVEQAVRYLRFFKEQLVAAQNPPTEAKDVLALLELCMAKVDEPLGGTESVQQELAGAGAF